MKRLMLKALFLFYKYYDKGSTKSIAYFSALIALMMIIFLNIFPILILFGKIKRNSKNTVGTSMALKYLIGFLIFIPTFLTLKNIFKKEDILEVK